MICKQTKKIPNFTKETLI